MNYFMLIISAFPLLASCQIEQDYYEPSFPGVQVERHHGHNDSGRYAREGRRHTHDHSAEREIIVPGSSRNPRVRQEPGNTHSHSSQAIPRRFKHRKKEEEHIHGNTSVIIQAPDEKNVHGHD